MRSTLAALERAPRLLPVADRGRAKTVLLEIVAQQAADLAIIVDDEDVGGGVRHGMRYGSCERRRGAGGAKQTS